MGLWGTSKLKFNTGKLDSTDKAIQDVIDDLNTVSSDLMREVEALKTNWNTPAGREYISKIDTDWSDQVKQYIKVLSAVDELLKAASKEYKKIETSSSKIKF